MRRTRMTAVGFSAILAMLAAAPAFAGYGALTYDEESKKYGLSSNEETQSKADDVALKECGGGKCKIIFRMGPRQCGAIALQENSAAWGAAWRAQRADAELAAMQDCQKHTKEQCKVREAACNR